VTPATAPSLIDIAKAAGLDHGKSKLAFYEHPLLPLPTLEEALALLQMPDGAEIIAELLSARAKAVRDSLADPLRYGFELPHWADADELLNHSIALIIFGGNRAGKSEYAAKRLVRTLMRYDGAVCWCLHESEETSIATQQKLVWKYLPPEIRAQNNRANALFKIRYSVAGGFTEGKVVFPNRSELYFLTYKQDPGAYEGWEIGATQESVLGAWADENMPLPWFQTLEGRALSRAAKFVWTYAPVKGLTPAMKAIVGNSAHTLRSRAAELLADRVNVPGLPRGHMPYIQVPRYPRGRVIYFHSDLNPFGKHYTQIKDKYGGASSATIEQRAYGYARDTGWRAFPHFGEWNIVAPGNIPAEGTNYMLTDPAGARNWFSVWWRVTPGNPADHYIYREWPDYARYGEWAVTAQNPNKFDGEPGPAQNPLGYGVEEYKRLFQREETIIVPRPVAELVGGVWSEPRERMLDDLLKRHVKQPQQRVVIKRAVMDGNLEPLREDIRERQIDPRAGRNQHAAERGGTCLIDKLLESQKHPVTGEVTGPPMLFHPASGVQIDEGINMINSLLFWDREQPMDPILNSPRLFVSEDCFNVRWALDNWTGRDGEHGACKDPVDLIRYGALARFRHITPGMLQVAGGGSY